MKILQLSFEETQKIIKKNDNVLKIDNGAESYVALPVLIGICLLFDWLYYRFFSQYGSENFWMNGLTDIGQVIILFFAIALLIDIARRQYRFYYLKKIHYNFLIIPFFYFTYISMLLAVGRLLACTMPVLFMTMIATTILGFGVVTLATIQTLTLSVTGKITAFGRFLVVTSRVFITAAIVVVIPVAGIVFLGSGSSKRSTRHAVQSSGFHVDDNIIFVGTFVVLCSLFLLTIWWGVNQITKPAILGYYIKRHPERYRKVLGLSPEVFYSYYWERTVKDPAILASIRAEQADQKSPIQ